MVKKTYGNSGKKREPRRADKVAEKLQEDVLSFWRAIGESTIKDFKKEWLFSITLGENAGSYLLGKDRYIYKGSFNQFMIAYQSQEKRSEYGPLIINSSDIAKMFFGDQASVKPPAKKKSVSDTEIVKNCKTMGSLFSSPYEKKETYWVREDGSLWTGKTKWPTKNEIKEEGLVKKQTTRNVFSTYAPWSAEDVKEYLPPEYRAKLDELVEIRRGKGYDYDPNDEVDAIVDSFLDDVIKRQGLVVREHGNSAFYSPGLDIIQKPSNGQFINPIVRYATTMHELAHSTMMVTGRTPGTSKVEYAKEEVLAESVAVFQVKQLERELEPLMEKRPELKVMFEDYYDNAMQYNRGWGAKFNFLDLVKNIEEDKKENGSVVKEILKKMALSIDALNNQEFTPEQRSEMRQERKLSGREQKVLDPEQSQSMGMSA